MELAISGGVNRAFFKTLALLAGLLSVGLTTVPPTMRAEDKPLNVDKPPNVAKPLNVDKPLNVAKALPIREVCLLLRGGYTSDEVLAEVNTRRLLEPVDAPGETQLKAAGATPALLNALKVGDYNLSPADADAARTQQAAIEQREQASRNLSLARQQADARRGAVQAAQPPPPKSPVMANLLRGQLVTLRNGQFQKYDDAQLSSKRLFAVYFSASWCGPCQKFTPSLVKFYNEFVKTHPEFEVIFFSNDRSATAMQQYMQNEQMPWAAVPFERRGELSQIAKLAGQGIPDLVLLDDAGHLLSDSYRNGQYVGPAQVVRDLMVKVGRPAPASPAQ